MDFLLVVAFFMWGMLFVVMRIMLAHKYLGFLAANFTNSCIYSDWGSISCQNFEWDFNLKIAAYSSYAVFFILVAAFCAFAVESKKTKLVKILAVTAYVFSFSTYSDWSVQILCDDGLGCFGNQVGVIVPMIMTASIYSALSCIIAIFSVWLYMRIRKVVM